MIDVAKLRIRRRRFVPALEAIVEERSSSGSPELTVAKSAESDSTGDSGVETTRASPALPADRTTDERLKVADWLLTAANSYVEPPRDYEDAEVLPPCRRLGHFGSVPHRRRQLSSSDPDRPSPSASLPRRRRSGDSRRPLSPALFLVPLKPLAEFGDFTF